MMALLGLGCDHDPLGERTGGAARLTLDLRAYTRIDGRQQGCATSFEQATLTVLDGSDLVAIDTRTVEGDTVTLAVEDVPQKRLTFDVTVVSNAAALLYGRRADFTVASDPFTFVMGALEKRGPVLQVCPETLSLSGLRGRFAGAFEIQNRTRDADPANDALVWAVDEGAGERCTGPVCITVAEGAGTADERQPSVLQIESDGGAQAAVVPLDIRWVAGRAPGPVAGPPRGNAPPAFGPFPDTTASPGVPYTGTLAAIDPDDDRLTFVPLVLPDWIDRFTDHGDGTATLAGTPGDGDEGRHTAEVRASDGRGGNTTSLFSIRVEAGSRAPVFTSRPGTEGREAVAYRYDVTTRDLDSDSVIITLEGNVPWARLLPRPAEQAATLFGTPDTTQAGAYAVTLRARDEQQEAEQSFTITIGENSPPVFEGPAAVEAVVGTPVAFEVRAADPDADPVQVDVLGPVDWLESAGCGAGCLRFTGTPEAGDVGAAALLLRAFSAPFTRSRTIAITVAATVDAQDDLAVIDEVDTGGQDVEVLANDVGDGLQIVSLTQPAMGTVERQGDRLRYVPTLGAVGKTAFTYVVEAAGGERDTATVTVVVNPCLGFEGLDIGTTFSVSDDADDVVDYIEDGVSVFVAALPKDSTDGSVTVTPAGITERHAMRFEDAALDFDFGGEASTVRYARFDFADAADEVYFDVNGVVFQG
ncbi:MAG: Ig-like domain-containing protein, partial [Rhodothermales bacterium]|nr:Ig-like domain-containing protein [Rhodothermales bacterium]